MKVLIIRGDGGSGCMLACAIVNGDEPAIQRIETAADVTGLTFTLVTVDSLAEVEKDVNQCAKEAEEDTERDAVAYTGAVELASRATFAGAVESNGKTS